MKKAYFILILLFFRFTNIEAQITFEKTYSFWDNSHITGVYPQVDGYILCGKASQFLGPNNVDYFNFIIKTDIYGDTIFTKTYKTSDLAYSHLPLMGAILIYLRLTLKEI